MTAGYGFMNTSSIPLSSNNRIFHCHVYLLNYMHFDRHQQACDYALDRHEKCSGPGKPVSAFPTRGSSDEETSTSRVRYGSRPVRRGVRRISQRRWRWLMRWRRGGGRHRYDSRRIGRRRRRRHGLRGRWLLRRHCCRKRWRWRWRRRRRDHHLWRWHRRRNGRRPRRRLCQLLAVLIHEQRRGRSRPASPFLESIKEGGPYAALPIRERHGCVSQRAGLRRSTYPTKSTNSTKCPTGQYHG